MLDFQSVPLLETDFGSRLSNVDWYDPWIIALILFHVVVLLITFLTRNHNNFQVIFFLLLLMMVYCSETINKVASNNWKSFSRQQYFDDEGIFISLVFCIPILFNCLVIVVWNNLHVFPVKFISSQLTPFIMLRYYYEKYKAGNWLYQSRELMKQVRVAQIQSRAKRSHGNSITGDTVISRHVVAEETTEVIEEITHRSHSKED